MGPVAPPTMPRVARRGAILLLWVLAACPCGLLGQPLPERTPNLAGPWVSSPWHLSFQFAHRFETAGDDDIGDIFEGANVVNYPTFDLSLGLPARLMTGVRYSSSSFVSSGQPNEWQPYLKWGVVPERGGGSVGISVLGAWNTANQSLDGEIAARSDLGPVFLSGAVRGFTDLYGDLADVGSRAALGLAGGLGLQLNRYVTLAGDVAGVVMGGDRAAVSPAPAWSAGLHVGIPFTPHTFSIMATNVTSGTLQGTSGIPADFPDNVYWGFEFTVPFSGFARWGRILHPGEVDEGGAAATGGRGAVEVDVSGISFQPGNLDIEVGDTVRWVNRDPVAHTITAEDGSWTSPLVGPGETYERTFSTPGVMRYHCTPHPFMTAMVTVAQR